MKARTTTGPRVRITLEDGVAEIPARDPEPVTVIVSDERPLLPEITLEDDRLGRVCQCCGAQDGTIRHLVFGWRDRARPMGQSQAIALCHTCRFTTWKLLDEEGAP